MKENSQARLAYIDVLRCIAILGVIFIHAKQMNQNFFFYYFPSQLPIFAMGIVLYYLMYEERRHKLEFLFLLSTPILFLSMIEFPFIDTSLLLWGIMFMGLSILLYSYVKAGFVTSVATFV